MGETKLGLDGVSGRMGSRSLITYEMICWLSE